MKPLRWLQLAPLALALVWPSAPGSQDTASGRQWRQTQAADALHSTAQFTLGGKFLKWPRGDATNRPIFRLECMPNSRRRQGEFANAYLLVGTPLKIDYVEPEEIKGGISYYPKVSVQYRLEEGKTREEQWAPGPDKNSTSIPKNVMEKMLRARTVLIDLSDWQEGEVSMQFDMPDATQVAQACGLELSRK